MVCTVKEDMLYILTATAAGALSQLHSTKGAKIAGQRDLPMMHSPVNISRNLETFGSTLRFQIFGSAPHYTSQRVLKRYQFSKRL